MATIKIRGRLEPITIENDRAYKVKQRKFGLDGVEKAEPTDVVDLGDWAGEYSRIVEIEMTKERRQGEDPEVVRQREEEAQRQKWLAMSPEEKAKNTGRFKLSYSMRLGDFKAEPPEKVMAEVQARLLKYYTENPKAENYGSLLDDLLPQKLSGAPTLAESKTVEAQKPNGKHCKNPKCGKELTGRLDEFCSGACMLAAKNGEVAEEKTYVFTREVKKWGVEAGDYYSPERHQVVGGTQKLLSEGTIKEEADISTE